VCGSPSCAETMPSGLARSTPKTGAVKHNAIHPAGTRQHHAPQHNYTTTQNKTALSFSKMKILPTKNRIVQRQQPRTAGTVRNDCRHNSTRQNKNSLNGSRSNAHHTCCLPAKSNTKSANMHTHTYTHTHTHTHTHTSRGKGTSHYSK
jgi:hypothetical protein